MLGEKMRKARESKGLSQAELARIVGISRSLYNKYERTNTQPSNEILLLLAHELDVTTDYLLGRNTPSNIEHFSREPANTEQKKEAPASKAETFVMEFRKTFGRDPDESDIQRALQHLQIDAEFRKKNTD